MRYGFSDRGLDLELYAGSVLDQLGVSRLPLPSDFDETTVTLDVYHPRYTLIAHAGARALGDFVLRWEASGFIRRAQAVRRTAYAPPVIEYERRSQVNAMLGATYFGIENANIGVEVAQSFVVKNPDREAESRSELLWPVEATNVAVRYQQLLARERVQLGVVGMLVGVQRFNGALLQTSLGYTVVDALHVRLEYVHYQSSARFGYFYGFAKNDRLDLVVSWTYALLR